MAGKVVVHSVDELSNYCLRLSNLKEELEKMAAKLVTLSDELQDRAQAMGNATQRQGSNWKDPQYEKLKGEISPCVSAVNSTSSSVKETAAIIKARMAQVENSIAYIKGLVRKLNDIS
ncbi:MAG: hypothetical protein H0S79_20840 [Anaerolineaceae bacterium]|nr:hypothetical protein [Anaerolineaceae bacterium]